LEEFLHLDQVWMRFPFGSQKKSLMTDTRFHPACFLGGL